jgi:ligand-binding sensor domain-containing protein/two-component sensor histidine kinase
MENGLPQESVNALCQTADGYLWLGTFDGLARFDGVRFVVFNTGVAPDLKNGRITSLFEDSNHRLWIGHESGGISRLVDGHFTRVTFPAELAESSILNLTEDEQGNVWVLNASGHLMRLEEGPIIPPTVPQDGASPVLIRDRSKTLWILRSGELAWIEGVQLKNAARVRPDAPGVRTICSSRDGGIWALVDGAFHKNIHHQWTNEVRVCPVPEQNVTTLFETAQEQLIIGTRDDGLFLIPRQGEPIHVSSTEGLSHNWILSLCQDTEGNLWVGTAKGGINVLLPNRIEDLNPPDQWQSKAVLSVTITPSGLWAGTEGAGIYQLNQGLWTHYRLEGGQSNSPVWAITGDASNRIWAGTWGSGLRQFKNEQFEPAPGFEDTNLNVTALLPGRTNDLWIGTTLGLIHYSEGKTNFYGRNTGLFMPDVRAMASGIDGSLWFGMAGGGLGQLKPDGNVRQWRKRDGLASDFINAIKTELDGSVWIGTTENGLSRYKEDRFTTIDLRHGLPDKTVCAMENDGLGNYWISSHKGIFRVAKYELNRCADGQAPLVHCLLYGRMEGLPTLECSGGFQPAMGRDTTGRLFIPTRKGIISIKPTAIAHNPSPPSVIIEEVLLDGIATPFVPGDEAVVVPPGTRSIEIRYTGISLSAPDKVRFSHQLSPLQKEWIDAGSQRTVTFTYLSPGQYKFNVIASNNDGVRNDVGARLDLNVRPRLWQTWWFQLLAVLFVLGIAATGGWWIDRIRTRQRLLKIEHQRAIERERARIARDIHDDLGASLTRIIMLSDPTLPTPEANIHSIYQTARNLTRTMDEIVWAVDPKHDSLESLAMYLGKFAGDFLRPFNIRCRLELPIDLPAIPLRAEARHNLFLAFKETLNNIVKHSGATEAHIALVIERSQFTLSIQDNGRGITPGATPQEGRVSSGNGLANIRRRMHDLGGTCEILSKIGSGVTVRLTYHFPHTSHEPPPPH